MTDSDISGDEVSSASVESESSVETTSTASSGDDEVVPPPAKRCSLFYRGENGVLFFENGDKFSTALDVAKFLIFNFLVRKNSLLQKFQICKN